MATGDSGMAPSGGRVLVITRHFAAPRTLVWQAFTEPERLARWWGPAGFTMRVHAFDLRVGGVFHYSMRSPAGQVMWGRFVYREMAAPAHLVFVTSFADEHGNITRSPFSATWPLEILNRLTLAETAAGGTMLTLRGGPINANAEEQDTFWKAQDSVRLGFASTFDQLAAYLAEAAKGA